VKRSTEDEAYACDSATGTCEDVAKCRVGDDNKCATNEMCVNTNRTQSGVPGFCHLLPQPQLTSAQFSSDCKVCKQHRRHRQHPLL